MHFLPNTQRSLSRENINYGLFFIYGMRILTIFGAMKFFKPDFIDFFKELAANNHKDWFDLNRKRYEQSVKKPFAAFTQYMIDVIAKENSDFNDLLAKDCIFRINRDIRFSNDKTPYKTMSSAVIATGGKKSTAINGIYFEFSAEHVRVYGGIYEINKEDLLTLRHGIADNLDAFKSCYQHPDFVEFFGDIKGDKNKVLPAALKTVAAAEPLLLNKQFYFYATFPSETVLREDLDTLLLKAYHVGKPLEDFFNQLIHRS